MSIESKKHGKSDEEIEEEIMSTKFNDPKVKRFITLDEVSFIVKWALLRSNPCNTTEIDIS
jgi:hypothetical protein